MKKGVDPLSLYADSPRKYALFGCHWHSEVMAAISPSSAPGHETRVTNHGFCGSRSALADPPKPT